MLVFHLLLRSGIWPLMSPKPNLLDQADLNRRKAEDSISLIPENPKVVALIPALNEEDTIGSVVRGALKYVDHVIVVDDLSEDNTAGIARRAGAQVISLKRRRRLGGVIRTGLEYVKKLDPDVMVMLDSDGQHEPSDIPRILKPILEGKAHWVIGSRFLNSPLEVSSKAKNIGRTLFSRISSFLVGQVITDAMSGFRALDRDSLQNLHLKFDYGYAPEMNVILCQEGYLVHEISIFDKPRKYGKTKVVTNKFIYVLKQLGIIHFTFLKMTLTRVLYGKYS